MKKFSSILLASTMVFAMASCSSTPAETTATTTAAPATEATEATEASETTAAETEATEEATEATEAETAVLSYADYAAAELETEVVIEAYVQGKQSWWDDKATVYLQDEDGAYFCYNMACSEADYELLTLGQKIRVTGFKTEWSGEVEIADATFEIIDGNFVATPVDVTAELGSETIIDKQNMLVAFKGMTVEASKDAEGNDVPFLYNWDGSGEQGNDLYFNVSVDGQIYTFTVESYLCDATTDVYQAVEAFQIGDVVDMEGFLYWYEGINPHITAVTPAA
ncbi:MAG: hypothetical protein MJ172_00645 [Clostridia bacterium]|nr:hypothetical protein [Clostridia bacterium]